MTKSDYIEIPIPKARILELRAFCEASGIAEPQWRFRITDIDRQIKRVETLARRLEIEAVEILDSTDRERARGMGQTMNLLVITLRKIATNRGTIPDIELIAAFRDVTAAVAELRR